jgi:hypothetical protein
MESVYLKNERYGLQVVKYDFEKLKEISIYRGDECIINEYDDKNDMDFSIKREMSQDYKLISESEFNEQLNIFYTNLKQTVL